MKILEQLDILLEDNNDQKPECKLVGTDGNVFSIIGKVSACLKKAGQADKAKEFQQKAMSSKSYDEVLMLLHDYVDAY